MFNITVEEAKALFEFTKQETIEEYVDLIDAKRMAMGQAYVLNETDVAEISRIYGVKPEKLNYFNLNIDQL